jgi:hypothetical protein
MASGAEYSTATSGGSKPPSGAEYSTATSGGSKPPSGEDEGLLNDIEEKMKLLQSMNPVMDSIYNGISIMCSVLMEYKNYIEKNEERSSQSGGGDPVNWTASIITADGKQAFTEAEGEQIHEFMTTYGGGLLEFIGLRESAIQSGGSKQAGKDIATQALSSLAEFIDPRKVSLDGAVEFILEYMDMMNDKSEDLAKQIGIIKLQNTIHGIPLQPIGIPYEIPTRLLFILLQGILEVLRLISLFGFPGAGIFRVVGSFLGGLIELFKGDWKSAIFTFMGIAGNSMLTIGVFAKIIVKVMSLMSNGSRDELFYAAYRSTKSLFIGFILFIITTFASFDIKSLITQNLDKLGEMLAKIQEQIDTMTEGAQGAVGECFTVEPLKLWPPPEKESDEAAAAETRYKSQGLDFDHLIRIQDLFNIPAFFCNATIRGFIDVMKFIPPARIVLELMGIPTTDRAHKSVCINLPQAVTEGEIAAAIMYTLRPQIRIKLEPSTGLPKQACAGSEVYGAAMEAQQALSSMFPVGTAGLMPEGIITAGIDKIKSLGAQYKPEGMKVALFGSKLDTSKIPGLSEQKKKEIDQLTSQTKGIFTKAKSLVPDILGVAKTGRGIFLPTTKERMAQAGPTMATLPPGK